ncbi:MAG: D-alanine--D-alanine ligase [Candidatus Omnitrophica bacterium]|nr:D-alanine--D-alanine ligase [Candidatus Omnitrophota bacterium]
MAIIKLKTQSAKRLPCRQAGKTRSQFGRVGVLMGGPSTEREISFKSGKAVYEALKQSGLEVVAIDINTDSREENISLIKSHKIDCAFLALHGRFGEDGQMQGILEILKIPYTGSGVQASRLAMDKPASREIFQAHGLNVPRYMVLERTTLDSNIRHGLGLPAVIKPAAHGSSIGLSIIDKEEGLRSAIDLAFTFDERVIIEEYIKGREVTVGILDECALPIIEIVPKKMFFDYEAKYQPGLTDYIVPAKLEEVISGKIKEAALRAHKLLGCFGCSRADMILNRGDLPYLLEVNTIPGLTTTSLLPRAAKCAGIEFNELCLRLIELAYRQ